MIIGCDFHPRFQQIAFVDMQTGEYGERRLNHPEEAERFYRSLAGDKCGSVWRRRVIFVGSGG